MRNSVFVVLIMLFVFYPRSDAMAQAYVTVAGYIACITKADKEKSTRYMVDENMDAVRSLITERRCTILKGGDPVYREDFTWGGLVEIRPKGTRDTLWTNVEAIKKK